MAYVLGFFAADGNMVESTRGNYYFSFYGSDKQILKKIKKVLESDHKLSKRTSLSGTVYRFQIGHKEMYYDLLSLGFQSRKTSRMIMPNIPKMFVPDFVRGYFDGDGNVWIGYINTKRKKPTHIIQAAFTSGSKIFLEDLLESLKKLGIRGGTIYVSKTKNFSRLQFSTFDALKLAEIMYNRNPKLFIKRKKLRFDQFRVKHAVVV